MRIAVCLIIRNENQYLQEWLTHYRNIGVNQFFIYDNLSDFPVWRWLFLKGEKLSDIEVVEWPNQEVGGQMRSYENCCRKHPEYDWIAFIDTDEFITLSEDYNTIQECLEDFKKKYGEFNGLGMSWRFYGNPTPPESRIPVTEYTHYHENGHIKSIINPKSLGTFPDPHRPYITGRFINELGQDIKHPICSHTSKYIWVKHIWARSREEFAEKMIRGRGDKCPATYGWTEFEQYNKNCIIND